MSKIKWICATCGGDFTRATSANRHNDSLHNGNGITVPYLEYIIGRLNGQFLAPDYKNNSNLSTKIVRKWWHNTDNSSSQFTGNNSNDKNNNHNGVRNDDNEFTIIPDQIGNALDRKSMAKSYKSN